RGLAAAAQAGDDGQPVSRDRDIDVLEVVLPGAANHQVFATIPISGVEAVEPRWIEGAHSRKFTARTSRFQAPRIDPSGMRTCTPPGMARAARGVSPMQSPSTWVMVGGSASRVTSRACR